MSGVHKFIKIGSLVMMKWDHDLVGIVIDINNPGVELLVDHYDRSNGQRSDLAATVSWADAKSAHWIVDLQLV